MEMQLPVASYPLPATQSGTDIPVCVSDAARDDPIQSASGNAQPTTHNRQPPTGNRQLTTNRSAFTLIELLVVIGLIVVIMALALPAFNFITGTRSIDGATNVVSSFLGRARVEALAAQRPTGVFFYIDPATERRTLALVQATDARPIDATRGGIDVWLDLLDSEPSLFPLGIDVQTISDGSKGATPAQLGDRYLGFNRRAMCYREGAPGFLIKPDFAVAYGGVILFDGSGRLISKSYGFRTLREAPPPSPNVPAYHITRLGATMYGIPYDPDKVETTPPGLDFVPRSGPAGVPARSALGLVLLLSDQFASSGDRNLIDSQIDLTAAGAYTAGSREFKEEAWLDENATPMLINRYNGTLVRGQ